MSILPPTFNFTHTYKDENIVVCAFQHPENKQGCQFTFPEEKLFDHEGHTWCLFHLPKGVKDSRPKSDNRSFYPELRKHDFDPEPFFAHDVMKVLSKEIHEYATKHGIPESQVAAKFDLVLDGRGHTLVTEIYVTNP